jgi:uroporphyrinogen decarboxylase
MNALERVNAVMRGEVPDRPPIFDLLRNDAAIEYYAGEALTQANRDRVVYRAIGDVLDSTKQFIRLPEEPRTEQLEDGRSRTYERWTYWTKPLPFRDVEEAAKHLKQILENADEFVGDTEGYVKQAEQDYLRKKKAIGDIALFLEINTTEGFHDFYESLGIEMLSYLIVDYPELIGNYLDLVVEQSLRRITALGISEMLPGVFYGVDLAYKTGPLFSPSFLRGQLFPRMERVINAYKDLGIRVMYHSDGNLWPILDDLVALGIDALNPIEVLAGMDLGELRKRYPDLVFIGGIDCSQLLPFATPQDISNAVVSAIEAAGPKYIVGSSTELHNAIPLDNIKAMIDTARAYQY